MYQLRLWTNWFLIKEKAGTNEGPCGVKLTFSPHHKAPVQGEKTQGNPMPSLVNRTPIPKQGSTLPKHPPSTWASLKRQHSSVSTSNLVCLAGERSRKPDSKAARFLCGPRPPLPRTSPEQEGPNPPRSPRSESLVRQTDGPPLGGGVPRALGTVRPTNSRARATQPGGRGEARAPEAALAHGPQLRANGNAHVERQRATGGPHSARVTACKKQARARARPAARPCAAPTGARARPSPTGGAEAREPRAGLRSPAGPRSLGPSGGGPPAPARRCVEWACCPSATAWLRSRPYQSPHPATPPPPLPPLYPPAPLHRPGPRFCRRCSKTDRIFSSQLPGRHLTFNPHNQWELSTPLARMEAVDPARAAGQT